MDGAESDTCLLLLTPFTSSCLVSSMQITPSADYMETSRAYFSGVIKKKTVSERVVVRADVDRAKKSCSLQVNCDDAMMSVALLDTLKKGIMSSAPIRKTKE